MEHLNLSIRSVDLENNLMAAIRRVLKPKVQDFCIYRQADTVLFAAIAVRYPDVIQSRPRNFCMYKKDCLYELLEVKVEHSAAEAIVNLANLYLWCIKIGKTKNKEKG